jgi:hypothetical protein
MIQKIPPVIDPDADLADVLKFHVGQTGEVDQSLGGGYRIKVCHAGMFPWDDVFKSLLYRDLKVYVTHRKADIVIEAQP